VNAPQRRVWTPDDVRALGVLTDFDTAADVLGMGRSLAYQLVRNGEFPVQRIQHGRRVTIRVADLLRYLGID
jgi:excisionase family DNA binding protein